MGSAARTCKNPAFARASASGSPIARPKSSAALFKAEIRGPPLEATIRTNGSSGAMGFLQRIFACAAHMRRTGHRGRRTETMRDMIVLHYPLTRPSVATALEMQAPARAHDETEAVALR